MNALRILIEAIRLSLLLLLDLLMTFFWIGVMGSRFFVLAFLAMSSSLLEYASSIEWSRHYLRTLQALRLGSRK